MSEVATAPVDIGTLIGRNPKIRNGQPLIAGTGVTVKRIVGWQRLGMNPEEIAQTVGHITVGQVHAALAYYYANKKEIDDLLAQEEADYDRLSKEYPRGGR
jgi:uncharacterized protein (DUF433 family)